MTARAKRVDDDVPSSRLADTKEEEGRVIQALLFQPHEGIKNARGQVSTPCARQSLCSLKSHSPTQFNLLCVLNGWSLWDVPAELFYPLDFGWVHPEGGASKREDRKANSMVFVSSATSQLASISLHVATAPIRQPSSVPQQFSLGSSGKAPSNWTFR